MKGETLREYLVRYIEKLAKDDQWLQEKEINNGDKLLITKTQG